MPILSRYVGKDIQNTLDESQRLQILHNVCIDPVCHFINAVIGMRL